MQKSSAIEINDWVRWLAQDIDNATFRIFRDSDSLGTCSECRRAISLVVQRRFYKLLILLKLIALIKSDKSAQRKFPVLDDAFWPYSLSKIHSLKSSSHKNMWCILVGKQFKQTSADFLSSVNLCLGSTDQLKLPNLASNKVESNLRISTRTIWVHGRESILGGHDSVLWLFIIHADCSSLALCIYSISE